MTWFDRGVPDLDVVQLVALLCEPGRIESHAHHRVASEARWGALIVCARYGMLDAIATKTGEHLVYHGHIYCGHGVEVVDDVDPLGLGSRIW